jgi:squalene synthase HpnC
VQICQVVHDQDEVTDRRDAVSQLARQAADVARTEPLLSPATVAGSRTGESDENFPVASRLLPGRLRRDLRAVYGVARAVDDIGDDAEGDRLALLDAFETDLRRAWTAEPPHAPAIAALVPTVRARSLSIDPFLSLVAANRFDQVTSTYPTWADLRHYCSLSADPVGRIVLEIFGAQREDRAALSDDVCTALQLLEHCQDVAEDRRRGRTYLPLEDLARFGVAERDLDAASTAAPVRVLVAYEVDRAATLLRSGRPLLRTLRGAGKVAVAGYVAGGLATVDALRRADFDVLAVEVSPRRRDTARHALRLLIGRP